MATSKKDAGAAGKILKSTKGNKSVAASDLAQVTKGRPRKIPVKARPLVSRTRVTPTTITKSPVPAAPYGFHANDDRPLPESVDDETIARLVAEAEAGIPAEKLRRRGRPAMGDEAASTYSVRLPDDLVTLADQRSQIDSVTRGETIRRALIEYLTK
ncbi:hypothetical protein H7J06_11610 [Mycobacterium hodleri]|uniref:hypothetical protein n=1 Tax=Mycolicibacterium hodleri TaxID=49897 RepID=UPI0021F262BD|nr:hypothetical protein [Mycolicibacterium hodleri]MCV7133633.1 hypothetical protein [Mycolicibacterium hodleri]